MNAERLYKRNVEAGRRGVRSAVALIATLGALATGLTDGGNSIQAFAQGQANPEAFDGCTSDMYIMRREAADPSMSFNQVLVDRQFELDPLSSGPYPFRYNAAGFNEEDNFIYAILTDADDEDNDGVERELIRIGKNGVYKIVDLAPAIELPDSVSADVGPDGFMYIYMPNTGAGNLSKLYRLDLKNPTDVNSWKWTDLDVIRGPMPDMAYHNGSLYGVTTNTMKFAKIDLSSAVWTQVGATPAILTGESYDERVDVNLAPETLGMGFGAMFGGSNGVYGNNNAGGFFEFDLTTGLVTKLAVSTGTSSNDGAKCYSSLLQIPSDVRLVKTSYPDIDNLEPAFVPGKKTQYRIAISNHKTNGITGISVTDPLPPGITNAIWTCDSGELICTPVSGTGPLNAIVNIPPQLNPSDPPPTVSYILEIDVPSDYTEQLVNTVTMTLPPLASQSIGGPITASVTKKPGLLTIEKVGRWIDTDKSNIANVGDHIEYTFTVTNNGQAPLTNVRVLDPLVTVEPASVASLAPGEIAVFTANYAVPQEDIDNAMTTNTASAIGTAPNGEETESPPATYEVLFPPAPEVATKKSGRFLDDLVANEFPDAGEHIEYSVAVKNTGNVTMVAYPPIDAGPTLNGKPMTGALSEFSPNLHMIPPGEEAVFTALYTLTNEDLTEGSGVLDAVQNTADTPVQTMKEYQEGKPAPPVPLEKPNVLTLPGYAINKQAQFPTVTRGQLVPYVITVRPVEVSGRAMLVDQLPPGFSYVPGSARVAGSPVQPRFEGRLLSIDLDVETGRDTRVEYTLAVTGAVSLGTHTNTAQVFQPGQILKPVSVRAKAEVDVVPDPVFDCGDVIGSVFDDRNRNGFQDPGEVGIPHARIASLNGALTTTDAHGRFSVACADLPDARIGKTYLMKLDPRSLPTGYRILSENPRAVRLTAGKVSKLNFSVSVGRVVRLDVNDMAFLPGEAQLQPQWEGRLTNIVELLKSEPTIFRIVYKAVDTSQSIHLRRLKNITDHLSDKWKSQANDYRLEIESKVLYSSK